MRFGALRAILVLYVVGLAYSQRYLSCKAPLFRNGRMRSRQRGRLLKFVCNPSYQLVGSRTTLCMNGTWDVPIPKCVRSTCPKRDSPPANGGVLPSAGGGVLSYYCKQGFELHGPDTVYCDGRNWDNFKPSCVPSQTKPPLFCDFESDDLCHWTHDLNHDMDWVRDSYKTPTGYSMPTGPSFDHTKGNGSNGHYMYIESSSRRINDTARLISPMFEIPSNVCLEFWYHMYGRTTGSLRTYIWKEGNAWPPKPETMVFLKSGNQGDKWYRAFIDLGNITGGFQVVMEGVRGNSYVSDTAIDDVKIIPNCVYEDYIQSTTETFSTSTEILKTIESCENRCGNKGVTVSDLYVISCACDDYCYEGSRCCPDYLDVCVGFTDGPTTDTMSTLPDTPDEPLEERTPTTKNVTKDKSYATTVVPTLVFLHPETTPQIVRKVKSTMATVPIRSTTVSSRDDSMVPIEPQETNDIPDDDSNDIGKGNGNPSKEDYADKLNKSEREYPIKIDLVDDRNNEQVEEFKTGFRQVEEESHTTTVTALVLVVIVAIVLLGIGAGVFLVKFRFIRLREGKRFRSGQGNSQSDVRFLTADEVLDFSLDKNYDEL